MKNGIKITVRKNKKNMFAENLILTNKKHMKKVLFSIVASLLLIGQAQAQLSKGNPCKFLGNITTRGSIPSDYATMWEQLTPENETKWGLSLIHI